MDNKIFLVFQYRKRYGLHAMLEPPVELMDAKEFQYRKRYGLHAICYSSPVRNNWCCFNTASGMDCMQ